MIDTHPGWHPIAVGAMAASSLIVVPTVLKVAELRALAGMVRELADYPLLVIPNRVPRIVPRTGRKLLGEIVAESGVAVGRIRCNTQNTICHKITIGNWIHCGGVLFGRADRGNR